MNFKLAAWGYRSNDGSIRNIVALDSMLANGNAYNIPLYEKTKMNIIELAKEAADKNKVDPFTPDGEWVVLTPQELERFAALVAAHEREACAELFESAPNQEWSSELVAYQIRNMRRSHQSKG